MANLKKQRKFQPHQVSNYHLLLESHGASADQAKQVIETLRNYTNVRHEAFVGFSHEQAISALNTARGKDVRLALEIVQNALKKSLEKR